MIDIKILFNVVNDLFFFKLSYMNSEKTSMISFEMDGLLYINNNLQ